MLYCCCTPADQEAARYLESYKAYEQKSAESIQEKVGRTRIEQQFFTIFIHLMYQLNMTQKHTVAVHVDTHTHNHLPRPPTTWPRRVLSLSA